MPKLQAVATPEWVFVDSAASDKPVFDPDDPISSRLQLLLFLYPGSVTKLNASELKFEELIMTGDQTGTVDVNEIIDRACSGRPGGLNPRRRFIPSSSVLHFGRPHFRRLKKEEELMSDAAAEPAEDKSGEEKPADAEENDAEEQGAEEKAPPKEKDLNVVLVCDIDCSSRNSSVAGPGRRSRTRF